MKDYLIEGRMVANAEEQKAFERAVKAAADLTTYFSERSARCLSSWVMGGVCSRDYAEKVELLRRVLHEEDDDDDNGHS